MTPPPMAKRIDQIREKMENKYNPRNKHKPNINNPLGHNRYTLKKDLVKMEKALTELDVFEKLSKVEQFEVINKMGNDLWRESKDYRNKKGKFTIMQKMYFGWDFE